MSHAAWQACVDASLAGPPRVAGPLSGYRSLAGGTLAAADLVRRSGGRAVPVIYGRSAEGRPLWAVRVGDGPLRVLYVANLHAMEFIGSEVVLALLERLVDDPMPGIEAWLIPFANPDGRVRAEVNAANGRRRFVRHNGRGVDLNRNFAVGFRADYWMHRLIPALYNPGAEPFSEPEAAALRDLCATHPPGRAISFHAFGGWIFHPWSCRADPTPDDGRFSALAARMAEAMRRPYRCAQLGRWARWFRAHGSEIDHLYGDLGTMAFLIEVSRGGLEARSPSTWADPLAWFNPRDPVPDVQNVLLAALALATAE